MPQAVSSFQLPRHAPAPDFSLEDTVSGARLALQSLRGDSVCLLMFICNHCPYVLHLLDALLHRVREFQAQGVVVMAISSNDIERYPQDGPLAMRALAADRGFSFPYLFDEDQSVARAYGAACTPDFFVLDRAGRLAWSGRFDGSTPGNGQPLTGADLVEAITAVLEGRPCDPEPRPSLGCSIKWKLAPA